MRVAQKEPGPIAEAGSSSYAAGQNGLADCTVFTRSSDLVSTLDADAADQVAQMVSQGWEATAAAEAWRNWVALVAQAAADGALAEGSWRAG